MRVLTINSGSSSIKFSLYDIAEKEEMLLSGRLERIGQSSGLFTASGPKGEVIRKECYLPGHGDALKELFGFLDESYGGHIECVGHRVVHGGSVYARPHIIDGILLNALNGLKRFAPEHLPHEITAIEAVKAVYPELKQVACFDTAFHRDMPWFAQTFPVTRGLKDEGVIRYGFHGLSYEYIMEELRSISKDEADGRVIIAHLGNGASMAAVKGGKGFDTTMGFTPAGGLMMSTRSGDLDPGVVLYLIKDKGLGADEANVLLNKRSGLLGISGSSSDMKDLLSKENTDKKASEAITLFCYQARKYIGALSAAIGGIDTLVFTGGMGENSPEVRERILDGLGFLGIRIDGKRNRGGDGVISDGSGPVKVRIIKTNEELIIAREAKKVLAGC